MEEEKIEISYEALWKAIIRPPRDEYTDDELGMTGFNCYGRSYIRKDYTLLATQGNLLQCSFIEPSPENRPSEIMPVVIYLHGNSSSRVEGCGRSEGKYISLGYHEKRDLKIIVDFVYKLPGVGNIGIWGRSMGAATGLIYAHTDDRIKCLCLDSPFSSFKKLAKELCKRQINLPDVIVETALSFIKKTIIDKNGMDITQLNPIDDAKETKIPVFFVHAMKDDLIALEHTVELYEICPSKEKALYVCEGNHNTLRQVMVIEKISNYFYKYLIGDNNI